MTEAQRRTLRTYSMLCPLIPGIADHPSQIDELINFAESINSEEIFAEPINPRGKSIVNTELALREAGYAREAAAVKHIRTRANWSFYVLKLVKTVQASVRKYSEIGKLRILLYSKDLLPAHKTEIMSDTEGVIWL